MTVPAPRPALRRDDDGSVHPAWPRLSSLTVDADAVAKSRKKAKKKGKDKAPDDDVELTVAIPKRDRKKLRRKAESYGWTVEEAAAHVIRVWADDQSG